MFNLTISEFKPPLKLVNDGFLSIFFLGTGSAFSKKIFQNNIIIIKGNNSIFVDFGTRASFALNLLGHNVSSIDNLIITHSHADHSGGVEEVLLYNRYGFNRKINLIVPEPYLNILWEQTLRGGSSYSEYNNGQYLSIFDFVNYIKPESLIIQYKESRKLYKIRIGDIEIIFFQTKHVPSNSDNIDEHQLTFGLIIDNKIIYSSDTKFDKDFFEFLVNKFDIEYIFHDCQFFTGGVHSSLEEINCFNENIKSKIFLMHYPDNFEDIDLSKYNIKDFVRQWHYYNFC